MDLSVHVGAHVSAEERHMLGVLVREQKWNVTGSRQTLGVAEIRIHENYRAGSFHDDIAMLILTDNITYTKYVRPVCLPQQDVPVGTVCITSGLGYVGKLNYMLFLISCIINAVYSVVQQNGQIYMHEIN